VTSITPTQSATSPKCQTYTLQLQHNELTKEEKMSYAYSYETNSISKWDTIQEDVADAYSYLDEADEEQPPLDDFDDEDDEQLAKLFALTWEN